jgi:hypothetical protein
LTSSVAFQLHFGPTVTMNVSFGMAKAWPLLQPPS